MSSINLSQAIPKRLIFSQGQWSLEVQRWHAIDRDLFNPISSYIPGPNTILRFLSEVDGDGHALAQAEHILSHPGSADTVFELHEGNWIAKNNIAEFEKAPQAPAAEPSAEMSAVLAHLETLQARLERLELRLQGRVAENDASAPSVRPLAQESSYHHERPERAEDDPVSQTG